MDLIVHPSLLLIFGIHTLLKFRAPIFVTRFLSRGRIVLIYLSLFEENKGFENSAHSIILTPLVPYMRIYQPVFISHKMKIRSFRHGPIKIIEYGFICEVSETRPIRNPVRKKMSFLIRDKYPGMPIY